MWWKCCHDVFLFTHPQEQLQSLWVLAINQIKDVTNEEQDLASSNKLTDLFLRLIFKRTEFLRLIVIGCNKLVDLSDDPVEEFTV